MTKIEVLTQRIEGLANAINGQTKQQGSLENETKNIWGALKELSSEVGWMKSEKGRKYEMCGNIFYAIVWVVVASTVVSLTAIGTNFCYKSQAKYVDGGYIQQSLPGQASAGWVKPQ